MERLTEKHYLGTDHYMKCSENCDVDMGCIDCPSFDRLVERLAAYEDTGLTPEQCENAKAIIESAFSDDTSKAERILELLKADKEGRVVVLPAVRYCEQYGWQNITWDEKYGVCAGSWNTREEAEKSLEVTKNE